MQKSYFLTKLKVLVTLYLKRCAFMTHVMNMKEVLCMFMTTVIKCHLLSYVIFNADDII